MENMNLKPWGRIWLSSLLAVALLVCTRTTEKPAGSQGLSLLSTCTRSDAIDNVAEAPTVASGQKLQGNYDVFVF